MDEYDRKFAEMQKYIPFLEAMIERLQNVKDKSREVQLQKMQGLHGILSNSKRKLKIETLQRCEDVLQKLHNKVEKGNAPGLHFSNKKGESNSAHPPTASEGASSERGSKTTLKSKRIEAVKKRTEIGETPASPSPPVTPDTGSQAQPIIIPTERSVDFIEDKSDSKPASPDQDDRLPTKLPIIIPTERTDVFVSDNSSKCSPNKDVQEVSFTEWEMLEESEKQNAGSKSSWQATSSHDVSNAAKVLGNSLPQKANEGRSHVPISSRHIPTVPAPSLGSSRRLTSVLEKSRLSGVNVDVTSSNPRAESPVNVPDVGLKSPDPDILFPKHKSNSPRGKDVHSVSKAAAKPAAPLLLSPPPVSTEPPLSMEDLAELLSEEGDNKCEKKSEIAGAEAIKVRKEPSGQDTNILVNKDGKMSKSFILTQADIDRESDRRWEEVDKHIVKLTSRKCLPNAVPTAATSAKVEGLRSNEIKGPPPQSSSSIQITDNRNQSCSPSSKAEPRYADNYEKHPRLPRDNYAHDNLKDKAIMNVVHCGPPEDDLVNPILVHHVNMPKSDDRMSALYQRRPTNLGPDIGVPRLEPDFRVDTPDYYNRQIPNSGHWQPLHPAVNPNEFCTNQWQPPNSFTNVTSPTLQSVPYPHPMGIHQEMWNVNANGSNIHIVDPHQMNDPQLRPNQFPPNMNTGIMPMISPTSRPPDMNHPLRPDGARDDLPNMPVIQPLMSPTNFPVGVQYRNFPSDNRPYDPVFDRGMEYPHARPTWDPQSVRPNDPPYRPETEIPCGPLGADGPVGPSGSYPRPSTPCPWSRDRANRGRGRDTYYNDRNRGDARSNFPRETRRPDWPRENHVEWDNVNRFNRDPRVRVEHNIPNQNVCQPRDNNSPSARDPRLAKDKHQTAVKSTLVYNERDPRKRPVQAPVVTSPRKVKEKSKSPKSDGPRRFDSESSKQEKASKDKMQSPLESLYGVIDTKAKSAQGYSLQNFKIPKIKRSGPSESLASSNACEDAKISGSTGAKEDGILPEKMQEVRQVIRNIADSQNEYKDDAIPEVNSSSDVDVFQEDWGSVENSVSRVEPTTKDDLKIGEADSSSIDSPKASENVEKSKKDEGDLDAPKPKDEVTQEWIEALIRKSFESGEGKKLVEQAKFIQKLGEALQAKKLKKIKKIIESESGSSSSDRDDDFETKKIRTRKKRRIIVSDSSDDECLAQRLNTLDATPSKEEQASELPTADIKSNASKDISESSSTVGSDKSPKDDKTMQEQSVRETNDPSLNKTDNQPQAGESQENKPPNETQAIQDKSGDVDVKDSESKINETTDDKDSSSRIPKAKAKRRNSLEMLQEDIREMFIYEGVVTATGHRMCRMQKENSNSSTPVPSQNSAVVNKKDDVPCKPDTEGKSDKEESSSVTKSKKKLRSRGADETSNAKSKSKNKVQRVTRRRSKQYNIQSSDSDEDQPLALRTGIFQSTSGGTNKEKENTSAISNKEKDNASNDADILRRSKRVLCRDSIKEPRILVEKTDISKFESSKVMFDSSSDESFNIDVAELAAAVDISLHPEKSPEMEQPDVVEVSRKTSSPDDLKKPLGKKTNETSADEKGDDAHSLTDELCNISETSMSSNVASGKKTNISMSGSESNGNDELLSNILAGLSTNKSSVADKESDTDADDDGNDQQSTDHHVKKNSAKKKKKKLNWQMGILSKKKKKKSVSSPLSKADSEVLNSSTETESSVKTDISLLLKSEVSEEQDGSSVQIDATINQKAEESVNEDNDSKPPKPSSNDQKPLSSCDSSSKLNNSKEVLPKSEPGGHVKNEQIVEDVKNSLSPAESSEEISSKSSNVTDKKLEYADLVDKALRALDVKQLTDYAWTGQDRYKCLLCFFTGKNIVHHYKLNHPGREILISRLKSVDAKNAIEEAMLCKAENTLTESPTRKSCKFNCRFCYFFTEGVMQVAMEAFYEHCTTHTGEYRFRCNSCPYQAVAKSSMRTHYYKVCRKFNDAFAESITEDEIPKENGIYGFICSMCNYVQLIKSNVEEHVHFWHGDNKNAKIVKINMSIGTAKYEITSASESKDTKAELRVSKPEEVQLQEVQSTSNNASTSSVKRKDNNVSKDDKTKIQPSENKNGASNNNVEGKPEMDDDDLIVLDKKKDPNKSLQVNADVPLPTGNLSAFVCPPELEKKEVEIQLERKRKMQEIIENIGITFKKSVSKKGLSIIDKLKDKMETTQWDDNDVEADNKSVLNTAEQKSSDITVAPNPTLSPSKTSDSFASNSNVTTVKDKENSSSGSKEEPLMSDKQPVAIISELELIPDVEGTNTVSLDTGETSNAELKVRDPLATVLDQKKGYESEMETSDNELISDSAPIYESDSSSEQSDSEPPTDVNMLLNETSSINTSSKDPMMTTIQRLAAQLKGAKPHEICKKESSFKIDNIESNRSLTPIPKPPNVVPISTVKQIVGKLDPVGEENFSETREDVNLLKSFIKLRRLSGDKLSVPGQPSEYQEHSRIGNNDANRFTLHADTDDNCSFLKIENVVSLAPRALNEGTENPIINDIRKAVETSPIKTKGISLLKKCNSPIILKKLNTVTITQPLQKNLQLTQTTTSDSLKIIPVKNITTTKVASSVSNTKLTTSYVPIAPKSAIIQLDYEKMGIPLPIMKNSLKSSVAKRTVPVTGAPTTSNVNYKIVKVVRNSSVLKPNKETGISPALKLKSADAYNVMLSARKLSHFYKCMAKDCHFTTDLCAIFQRHFTQHTQDAVKRTCTQPYDHQSCAYCYMILDDWDQMKSHLEERHAHCRYQCSYCFYRGIVPSYVQIHRTLAHPGYYGMLVGKYIKDVPLKEEINRQDYVHPYVCKQDCSKYFYVPEAFATHLKSKHGTETSTFKCHLCSVTCPKVDQLISHYRMHGFYKYQCLYCLNGTDTVNEMRTHLSTFHCNRLPQVLERSLPPQPTRNKDVIEQLIIRNLNENIKQEEVVVPSGSAKDGIEATIREIIGLNMSPIHKIAFPQLPKEITNIDDNVPDKTNRDDPVLLCTESINDTSQIEATDIISTGDTVNNKLSGNASSDTTNTVLKTGKQSAQVKLLSKSENGISLISENVIPKESTQILKQTSHTSSPEMESLLSVRKSTDLLDASDKTDYNDEYVNINVLDNPEFVKRVNKYSTGLVPMKKESTVDESKVDDDIEILDDIENTAESTPKKKNVSEKDDEAKSLTSGQKTPEKDDSISCNANDNTTSTAMQPDKLLTLEDIKNTGFTGITLYKCGYESCTFSAPTAAALRSHSKECVHGADNKNLNCFHCNKRFVKVGFLLEHLKLHGLKRFGCSLCKMRCTVSYQAIAHMKGKHKFPNSKLVPADPTNPSADGLFVVQPIISTSERKGKKRKSTKGVAEKDSEKSVDVEKLSFSPDDIDSLPRQAIYNREVHCAVCPYTTKVRTNIIRHLQLHAKDETVPESGPVNPVPCLDKKERMFDKMVNLASSSHQNGRMGGKPKEPVKDDDEEFVPKFVPEHKRYVCGVAECNYLTVDEAMLRYHLKALHSEEPYFRCPHCPQPPPGQEGQNIAIDKMGVHLKMHDTRLYKCSHCIHHHYHRHVVERHLTDKHPEKRPFVKVIRELESTENIQQPVQEETEEEVPDPDGNHWKCNICEYKCVYKAEMVSHASTVHDEKSQFKCTLCSFKTSGKILFEQHITSKHSHDPNVDYIMVYQRIKGVNKKNTDTIEPVTQDEPFDTTPLWRRDMPRIRHIRGILLEDETEVAASESMKTGKRKNDTELVPNKPAKIKPGKSASLDENKQLKDKSKRSLSCEKITPQAVNSKEQSEANSVGGKLCKDPKNESNPIIELCDEDVGRFGPYGKPDGNFYVCTLCTQFKSKYKHDTRDHLYRELNYARWHCKDCGYLTVNRNGLLKHFAKHHPGERPTHEPLSPDNAIEDWVRTLLKKQTCIMKGQMLKSNADITASNISSGNKSEPLTVIYDSKTSSTKVLGNANNKNVKIIDLTNTLSNLSSSMVKTKEAKTDIQEGNSKDNKTLTSVGKDETPKQKEQDKKSSEADKTATSESTPEKPLSCKHCHMTFSRWRGFKLHVQLTHLKRLGFICPYCDRSTNSETLMLQHIRKKHPGCQEEIRQNPDAGGPELTDEFWEKEYGIVCQRKSPKKRKRRSSVDEVIADKDVIDQNESQEKCTICGFVAINFTGLKSHMRIHTSKGNLKCTHCAFLGSTKAELLDHWDTNHPYLPFKIEELSIPGSSTESGIVQHDAKHLMDDCSDMDDEPDVSGAKSVKDVLYCCFYCAFRSQSIENVRQHWRAVHRDSKQSDDPTKSKTNPPFRYKEIKSSLPPASKLPRLSQCPKTDTGVPYDFYLEQTLTETSINVVDTSGTKLEGWTCQWCNELCDSEAKMKGHHNMFHSHLPLNFKKQCEKEVPKGYACPECNFNTTFINVMKSHVSKHINLFKCKYCDKAFSSPAQVSSHSVEVHPDLTVKIESIPNYDVLMDKIMARIKWFGGAGNAIETIDMDETIVVGKGKNHAVAKKSTARSTIRTNPIVCKVKAVARKSTNPLSRYLTTVNSKSSESDKSSQKSSKSKQFSYYGVPMIPVNLSKLNTYMVVGGHRMKVNCTTLAQLININPRVVVKDFKRGINNAAVASKLK